MPVKNLTITLFPLLLWVGCGRQPEIRTYTEVVQLPESATQTPPSQLEQIPDLAEMLRAAPLDVEPVPENLPPDHPTITGRIPVRDIEMHDADRPEEELLPTQPLANPNAMVGRESEVPPPPETGDLAWDLPPGWTARAGSGLRVAEFLPDGDAAGPVVTLIALGGPGGNVDANIARWRGQVGLSPSGDSNVQTIQGQMPFTFMTLVDESSAAGLPTSTIAAIYALENRSVFLKMMGPTEVVAGHKLNFLQLAGSLRVQGESS